LSSGQNFNQASVQIPEGDAPGRSSSNPQHAINEADSPHQSIAKNDKRRTVSMTARRRV